MTTRHQVPRAEGRDLQLSRWFDAPRELVFRAWTEAEHMKQWWGPPGFMTPVCELDPLRAVDMEGPLASMEQGWSQSLEKLHDLLAASRGRA